jgi:hypothetical protein
MSDIPYIKHPRQGRPGQHKPHHSDHSGAHAAGTHEHMQHAEDPMHGMPQGAGAMAEGSPAEEAGESPQEEAAEQSAGIGGAAGPGGTEGSPV